jgi:opacity protein-like surface antigen
MKRILVFTAFSMIMTVCFSEVKAQDKLTFKIGYNTGMPVGSFKDMMGKNSFSGFLGELNYPVNEKLRVGLGVSYNDYYEKIPRQLYHTGEGTVSAVVSNSIQTTPVMVKAAYELTNGNFIRPYAGIGAGFNLISYTKYFGEFGNKKTAFKPAAGAEAGINIPFNRETRVSGINLGAHFNYLPFDYNELSYLNNWGIHVAAYFPLR